jgi:hypothetical protein
MPYETFDLHFEKCEHTLKIPLLHNVDDSRCFICLLSYGIVPYLESARSA